MSEQFLCVINFDGDERLRVKQMIYVIGVKYIGYMIYGNFVIICGRYVYVKIFYFIVFDFFNLYFFDFLQI